MGTAILSIYILALIILRFSINKEIGELKSFATLKCFNSKVTECQIHFIRVISEKREKKKNMTQVYDKNPYTLRKIEKAN